MSSCLSGGGRTYNLNLDLIKSPTSSSWTSNYSSSSSSSTLSESKNSISPRKARTPRKRPNQTYNEAASILSTAYPKLFPAEHLTKPCKFSKHKNSPFLFEPSGLFTPPKSEKPGFSKTLSLFERPSRVSWPACDDEDFDAESILDEEVEEGIDSIMGSSSEGNEDVRLSNTCYSYPVGFGFEFGNGMRNESKAMKNGDDGDDWWRFPSVNVADITRKIAEIPVEKKKNKCLEDKEAVSKETFRRTRGGHLLKLNYEDVLRAWADRGSPFSGDGPAAGDYDAQVCNPISGKTNKKYKSF